MLFTVTPTAIQSLENVAASLNLIEPGSLVEVTRSGDRITVCVILDEDGKAPEIADEAFAAAYPLLGKFDA